MFIEPKHETCMHGFTVNQKNKYTTFFMDNVDFYRRDSYKACCGERMILVHKTEDDCITGAVTYRLCLCCSGLK